MPSSNSVDPEVGLPIRMLHDRVLVSTEGEAGERRSGGGILIPATVAIGKRLGWAEVVAAGSNVRTVKVGDRVLFDPDDRAEVEIRGKDYVLLRERDLHAVATEGYRTARPACISRSPVSLDLRVPRSSSGQTSEGDWVVSRGRPRSVPGQRC